ncbi:dihydrofolate reductase family protein [Leifsonia sp. NPDC080035]|uniref:Dihydrofolate reductase family protein n=1 Tax=Leifsonia sp. NPDC080035 TaxID=3143936 RepID=A0AAU7GAL0_9MICO
MSAIFIAEHISLEGVMQAPGRADEDTRGGFRGGGWATAGANGQVTSALADRVGQAGGMRLLLGRRSYDDMLSYWNAQGGPFAEGLNAAPKYVVSRQTGTPLPWPNSTPITGDVVDAIRALKREPGPELCVMGSGELVDTLLRRRLAEELLLFIHPLLLGSGRRLFPAEGAAPLAVERLSSAATETGVVIARYRVRDVAP